MVTAETFERYAALRVPRYTSYPTAPQFGPDIGESDYREWLASLDPAEPVSLYLHIPFCRAMCFYCGCHTSVTRRRPPVERYVDALIAEIGLLRSACPGPLTVRHLHWGGGSPTLLEARDIDRISAAIGSAFRLAEDADQAVEVDPRTLTPEAAAAFAASGVIRASVGVQSFDPKVQMAINRVQSVEATGAAVDLLRRSGIGAINFDLIYGLPYQTRHSCLETVAEALAMRPDRFAVFGYAHVPSFKPHQRRIEEKALPDARERGAQARAIADALVAAGHVQVGLDHFALPGDSLARAAATGALHRNFQGYTTDPCKVLIGLGASAIGKLPQGFVQNTTNIPDYERRVAVGKLPITRGCRISRDDARRAAIIERIMCEYCADIGTTEAKLDPLEADGLIRRRGTLIEVTPEARPLVRAVAAAFDAYLPQSSARHVTAL